MKKLFLLLMCCIGAGVILAQSYVPFPDSNAYWNDLNHYQGVCDPPDYCQYTHFIDGDTILDGKLYHKVYTDDGTTIWYEGGIREEDKRVYFYFNHCSNSLLLYDFNLNIGDSIPIPYHWECDTSWQYYTHVVSIDSILLEDMSYRKKINLDYGAPWIEGIGSSGGLLYNWWYNVACICWRKSVCFEHNNVLLYIDESIVPCFNFVVSNNDLSNSSHCLNVYPNPANSCSPINFTSETDCINEIEIYDILGKRIRIVQTAHEKKIQLQTEDFKAGFYIYKVSLSNKKNIFGKLIIE